MKLLVNANKLNKRSFIPSTLPETTGITGVVNKGYTFEGTEVQPVPNDSLGKWYKDRDNSFYWGGALSIVQDPSYQNNPGLKPKIFQVVNVFETGSAAGNYGELVKYKDYRDSATDTLMVQVTFGRSQTTEFGHLQELVHSYVDSQGTYADKLAPYVARVGKMPSLATDPVFCDTLVNAGKTDPVMRKCQDDLFESQYYQPAYNWFSVNGFTFPLSMLVIYDSQIHSGGILSFLRSRFNTVVPVKGGDEKQWIKDYISVRKQWLANHSNPLLRATVYRMKCFEDQINGDNWDLSKPVMANGVLVS